MHLYPSIGNYNSWTLVLILKFLMFLFLEVATAIWCMSLLVAFLKTFQSWFVRILIITTQAVTSVKCRH